MKTIELSEEKARTLAAWLAPRWADIAMRIAAGFVQVNAPYRLTSERNDAPAYKRRVAKRKKEMLAIGAVLEGLGVKLPAVDRDAIVRPYTRPGERKVMSMWAGGTRAENERGRLTALILEQVK